METTAAARRLADEHAISLNGVRGSGAGGRVLVADVRRAIGRQRAGQVKLVATARFEGPEGLVEVGDALIVSAERADRLVDTLRVARRAHG